LETNVCIAVPKIENDEMEIFSSTQSPTLTQEIVSNVLGVSANR
jgi:xanthine dehydrogenase/oxidase